MCYKKDTNLTRMAEFLTFLTRITNLKIFLSVSMKRMQREGVREVERAGQGRRDKEVVHQVHTTVLLNQLGLNLPSLK